MRGEQVKVPTGETTVKYGDQVIVFTLPETLEQVERIFHG